MSGGAGYDYGVNRIGSGKTLSYEEISKACTSRSWQNGLVGALFLAPVPVGGGLTAAESILLGGLSFFGVSSLIKTSGYAKCMDMNFGIAIAPVNGGAIGLPVNDTQAKIWSNLSEAQRIRAAKFVAAGGTVQSALLPD